MGTSWVPGVTRLLILGTPKVQGPLSPTPHSSSGTGALKQGPRSHGIHEPRTCTWLCLHGPRPSFPAALQAHSGRARTAAAVLLRSGAPPRDRPASRPRRGFLPRAPLPRARRERRAQCGQPELAALRTPGARGHGPPSRAVPVPAASSAQVTGLALQCDSASLRVPRRERPPRGPPGLPTLWEVPAPLMEGRELQPPEEQPRRAPALSGRPSPPLPAPLAGGAASSYLRAPPPQPSPPRDAI